MTIVPPLLQAADLTKSFGRVQALTGASIEARTGEVLGIVGDNGAGKSTLFKVLSGVFSPTSGELRVDGRLIDFRSPTDSKLAGVATVPQDLALVEVLDVATNLFLGDFPRKGLLVDRRRMEREATELLNRLNVRVKSVLTPVSMLSGGQRQIVAISRAVRRATAKVVLLDEPTAALGVQETAHVGTIVENLKKEGKAIMLISHDLDFVFRHADYIQVMRLGRTSERLPVAETTRDDVVSLITGARGGQTA